MATSSVEDEVATVVPVVVPPVLPVVVPLVVPPDGAGTPFVLNKMDTGPLVVTLTVSCAVDPTTTSATPRGPMANPEAGRRMTEVEVAGGGDGGGGEGGDGGGGEGAHGSISCPAIALLHPFRKMPTAAPRAAGDWLNSMKALASGTTPGTVSK